MTSAERFAADLLRVGAVHLRPDAPFTWASGRLAPIYCDNRLTLADAALRREIAAQLADAVGRAGRAPTVVVGTATAGIPHATLLADRLSLPLVYVRSAPKAHGTGRLVEGRLPEGARAVVVEDTVSTGGSSLAAVEALRAEGAAVDTMVALFTYGLASAAEAFRAAGVRLVTLTDYDALVEIAAWEGDITRAQRATLDAWRADPGRWSAERGGAA